MIRDEGLGALRKGMGPTFDEFSRCCPCPFKLPKPAPLLILPAFPSFLRLFLPLSSLLHFSYPRFTFFYNVEELRGEGGGGASATKRRGYKGMGEGPEGGPPPASCSRAPLEGGRGRAENAALFNEGAMPAATASRVP